MKTVCVKCQCELKVDKIGVAVLEMIGREPPGEPYRLWHADRLKCPGCGLEVIDRFANKPVAEHFQSGFSEKVKGYKEIYRDFERPIQRGNG